MNIFTYNINKNICALNIHIAYYELKLYCIYSSLENNFVVNLYIFQIIEGVTHLFNFIHIFLIFIIIVIIFIISQLVISAIIVGATRKLIANISSKKVKKYINLLNGLIRIPKFPIILDTIEAGYDIVYKNKNINKKYKKELKDLLIKRNIIKN